MAMLQIGTRELSPAANPRHGIWHAIYLVCGNAPTLPLAQGHSQEHSEGGGLLPGPGDLAEMQLASEAQT